METKKKSTDSLNDQTSAPKAEKSTSGSRRTPQEEIISQTNLQVTEDIFTLRKTNFVLWRPARTVPVPKVYIARIEHDYINGKIHFDKTGEFELLQSSNFSDLWLLNLSQCNLVENTVYYYWFIVANSNPYDSNEVPLYCTDPFATVVDERFQASNMPVRETGQNQYSPAGVFLYREGEMIAADPDKVEPDWENSSTSAIMTQLPPNNRMVIYELPPMWSESEEIGDEEVTICKGNFRQVAKMIAWPDNSTHLDKILGDCVLPAGEKKYLQYLGINALELTPPANSADNSGWQYGTANYLAPDYH